MFTEAVLISYYLTTMARSIWLAQKTMVLRVGCESVSTQNVGLVQLEECVVYIATGWGTHK